MSGRPADEANEAARTALAELAASLTEADLAVDTGEGWTVAMVLAHLAFWDRWQVARWRAAARDGLTLPGDLPDAVADLANSTLAATWAALAPRAAAELALAAAAETDAVIAALPDTSTMAAIATGRGRLVDRSIHRHEHVAQIRRALWDSRPQG